MKKNKLLWIYVLSASIYFVQGIEGIPGLALFKYMKEKLHFSPSTIMYLGCLISVAWLIKPIFGYVIDNYFNKKKWIFISLIGSLLICFYLGLSPFLPLFILVPLLMLGNINSALRDVSCDGIMCVEGKEANECDSIQSIQWISITVASIIVGLLGGWIADHSTYKIGYLCLLPIYLAIMLIVSKYRTTVPKHRTIPDCYNCKFALDCTDKSNLVRDCFEKRIKPTFIQSILSYKELFTNKQFLLGCAFIFIYQFAPGFGTPLQFIEIDKFKWSYTFMGTIGAISSGLGILGAIVYYKVSKQIDVKRCLFWSVFIVGLTNIAYLWFTPITAIVYSFIFSILGMFIFLNMMVFLAKSTLPGKEATSFALLCSVSNLSGVCSNLAGAWLFPILGLKVIIIIASLSAFLSLPILRKLEIK